MESYKYVGTFSADATLAYVREVGKTMTCVYGIDELLHAILMDCTFEIYRSSRHVAFDTCGWCNRVAEYVQIN